MVHWYTSGNLLLTRALPPDVLNPKIIPETRNAGHYTSSRRTDIPKLKMCDLNWVHLKFS